MNLRAVPMPDDPHSVPVPSLAAERFYGGALDRIRHFMAALAALLTLGAWWKFGTRAAIGFALGCAIAWVNFYWLKRVIAGFADRATACWVCTVAEARTYPLGQRYLSPGCAA